MERQTDLFTLSGYALVLGASSGFGAAASRALARGGMDIVGVHLDRRAGMAQVEALRAEIHAMGRKTLFYNVNAADEQKRQETLDDVREKIGGGSVRVLLHSLAFGTLRPYIASADTPTITKANMDMTLDVMAHSLVYWTQDCVGRALLGKGGRVFAMTSAGSTKVWAGYGAVSAAKAALEAHIRQLAVELAPRGITANAICAGVTDTPALRKIPGHEEMIAKTVSANPHGRLTTPEDVAHAIALLAMPASAWITGNVLYVDGGEYVAG
jgi:NAD(P)-dependent dehydrogenase (short-subunit alcohol dehydrogenase family)